MNHLMMGGRKRKRKEEEEEGNLQKSKQKKKKTPRPSLGISDLSDDLIEKVLKFVGRGNFLFVAAISKQFYQVYERVCENENENDLSLSFSFKKQNKKKKANQNEWW